MPDRLPIVDGGRCRAERDEGGRDGRGVADMPLLCDRMLRGELGNMGERGTVSRPCSSTAFGSAMTVVSPMFELTELVVLMVLCATAPVGETPCCCCSRN